MFSSKPNIIVIATLGLLLTACGGTQQSADGNRLYNKSGTQTTVYKHDKSIQCGESGIPVDDMRLELAKAGIDVICAQKTHDGLGRPAVCGAATGNINAFVIHDSNLPDAEKLGFKSVDELPDYPNSPCKN